MDLPGGQVDKEQHIVCHQAIDRPDLRREEIRGDEHIHVGADKFLPGRRLLTTWSWGNAMTFQEITHGLVADVIAQVL